jgi:aspartate racemase
MSQLRRLGLLGGMSWQSSAGYYRRLNELVQGRVGGHASAPLVLWSVDFAEIEALQRAGDWDGQGRVLAQAARGLQAAGVDAIALATNTLHIVSGAITDAITVPFVDLIDVAASAVAAAGYERVGLLATDYTMTSDLYPARLAGRGVATLVPDEADRATVHRVIYDELVRGVVTDRSRAQYLDVIERLVARGAQAVLLACTEIGLLLRDGDASVPLLDTTELHCAALVEVILDGALAPTGVMS